MPEPHEHDWQKSPLLCYLNTVYDGPNYRTVRLEVCKGCGLLRCNGEIWAGHSTWDDARDAKQAKDAKPT